MATNQTTVGNDLYAAISQFLELFPALRPNAFYITGEVWTTLRTLCCARCAAHAHLYRP